MTSVLPDWDKIVLDAVFAYYKSLNNTITDEFVSPWFKYSELVKAVNAMRVINDQLVCDSKYCKLVQTMWTNEQKFFKDKLSIQFTKDGSAVRKTLEGLVIAARFKDSNGKPLTNLEKSNFFVDGIPKKLIGYKNKMLLPTTTQNGGANTKKVERPWQKNLTQRLRLFKESASAQKKIDTSV
jgi:hypothetical protein